MFTISYATQETPKELAPQELPKVQAMHDHKRMGPTSAVVT